MGLQLLQVRLTVIDGERRFIDYLDPTTHQFTTTSGSCSCDGNEALVHWMGPAVTMAVARHEITHLALGTWRADTPYGSTRAWPNPSSDSSSKAPMPRPWHQSGTWTTSSGCTAPAASRPCAPSWRWTRMTETASATTSSPAMPGRWYSAAQGVAAVNVAR